jgi:UDPglucose--hexose-1-phosphate uridylyltransferase
MVIVAPERARRPHQEERAAPPQKVPRYDPTCPFCPGNEAQLSCILAETSANEAPGWSLRVVPNKYPALASHAPPVAHTEHLAHPGRGIHEVIIESPRHDADAAAMSAVELCAVVEVYRARSRHLMAQEGVAAAVLFRNRGRDAGASLAHPHAQIVALDIVPPRLAGLSDWGRRYHGQHGCCALCDEIAIERKLGLRIVDETDGFVALVPFAAEHPFETWIAPKQHQPSFAALADEALAEFAGLLGRSLRRQQAALGSPAYNFAVDSAPSAENHAPYWHWKIRLVPEVAIWGGFELGGGLPINPSSPEDNARRLRAADAGP